MTISRARLQKWESESALLVAAEAKAALAALSLKRMDAAELGQFVEAERSRREQAEVAKDILQTQSQSAATAAARSSPSNSSGRAAAARTAQPRFFPPAPQFRAASDPLPGPRSAPPLPINIDLLNWRARQAQGRRAFGDAVKLYERAIFLDPLDGRAWLGLARHELNTGGKGRGNVERARDVFKEGIKACPDNAHLLQGLGSLEERAGDLPLAMTLYQQATFVDSKHAASWVSRGRLENRLKRVDRARACFRRAIEVAPQSYYAWHCWAMLEADARNLREARELFQRALDANARNAATYQAWGVLEAKMGDLVNATALFARGHKVQPRNTHILAAWASAEHRRGNGRKAVELFEKAIEARPSDAGAYQQYAVVSKELGDVEGARRLFALGSKANKQHLRTYQEWGLMEAEMGSLAQARAVFQQGVWAAPRGKGVASLWQAWALVEADAGFNCFPTAYAYNKNNSRTSAMSAVNFSSPTKPVPWMGLGVDVGGSGTAPVPEALQTARKYFQFAVDACQQAYPTAIVVAWAKTEERYAQIAQARTLLEEAAVKDGGNKRLWAAYEAFEGRVGDFTDVKRISQRAALALLRGTGKSVDETIEASKVTKEVDEGTAMPRSSRTDVNGKSQRRCRGKG